MQSNQGGTEAGPSNPSPTLHTSVSDLNSPDSEGVTPAKRKRKEGPRSRDGCGTCKGRKKKCDEQFDANGSCKRCVKGGFPCLAVSTRPSRARGAQQQQSPPVDSNSSLLPMPMAIPPLPIPATPHTQPRTLIPQAYPFPMPTPTEAMDLNHLSIATDFALPDYALPPFPFPPDFDSFALLDNILGSVDAASSGLEYLPTLLGLPTDDNELGTGPIMTSQATVDDLAAVSDFVQSSGTTDASPSTPFRETTAPPVLPNVTIPQVSALALRRTSPASTDDLGWEKEALEVPPETRERTLVEIRDFSDTWWDFYDSLNDSYFYSIPREARATVKNWMKRHMLGNSDLGRGAVSAWCSSHFSSVLLKERSPDFAEWNTRAGRYYQQTLSLLYDPKSELVFRLGALSDLRLSQMNRHGAAPCMFLLLAGEIFIREAFGDQPTFNFATQIAISDLALRVYCYTDVLRTLVLRNRPTLFHLKNTVESGSTIEDDSASGPAVTRRMIDCHLGLPVTLLICLGDTSNLIVKRNNGTLTSEEAETEGKKVEQTIREFNVDAKMLSAGAQDDSAWFVSELASQEMWRHACLIYLYSSLFRYGPLAKVVRTSLQQILKLSCSLVEPSPSTPSVFVDAARSPVWFIAATVATTESDREQCREGLMAAGPGRMFVDNHKAIERLWAEVDATGTTPEWREFVEREGLKVGFM